MTCEHCGTPLLTINGQDQCGRCDTPRPKHKRQELEPARNAKQERQEEQRDAEDRSVHTAKLAAAEAFDEVRELVGDVRAARLRGELKDSAKSAQYLATTAGILTDKALLLEGRPTNITHHDTQQDWHSVAKRLGVVDATAIEVPLNAEEPAEAGSPKRLNAAS